jgi:hypothetical protein
VEGKLRFSLNSPPCETTILRDIVGQILPVQASREARIASKIRFGIVGQLRPNGVRKSLISKGLRKSRRAPNIR